MDEQYILKTLSNAIDVLELFDEEAALTPKEIENRIKMNRTNLYRILYTLRHRGLLDLDPQTGEYKIGLKVFHLASLSLKRLDVKTISHPFLQILGNLLNESIHLVVKNNQFAIFVDKIEANEDVNMGSYIGWSAPLYCTASGKLLISYESDEWIKSYFKNLDLKKYTDNTLVQYEQFMNNITNIREKGYSSDEEEMVEGLTCFAVPIIGHSGKIVAAVSVSGATTKMNKKKELVLEELKKTATEISKTITRTPQGVL
ncbi:IclR family transcriptional regulator [Cytobacillus depressus]|uniref:IclR family transcriptional regulator n=1 Tax=Cytobacillus depressus TaxID=1602942 RepID=A0A6L3V2J3_9BACI|nr:IclR family transcriptional regulator [Cytobacillus depressus]KAB2330473.1 IclR family transcriptional regulator [Cytobacillus depressus]